MGIAEQMGRTLQRTSISVNIKERLDFSCALFGPDGDLVANAPHLPVHLGAMSEAVKAQVLYFESRCGVTTRHQLAKHINSKHIIAAMPGGFGATWGRVTGLGLSGALDTLDRFCTGLVPTVAMYPRMHKGSFGILLASAHLAFQPAAVLAVVLSHL